MVRSRSLVVGAVLSVAILLLPSFPAGAAGSLGDDQADAVWGQPNMLSSTVPNSTTNTCTPTPTAANLCGPFQDAIDSSGNLWVADSYNNRVLMYPPGSTAATKVFGQAGSFTTSAANLGRATPAANSLSTPAGVAVDANGTLFVSDAGNNRILVYYHAASKPADPSADLVLGQPNFTSSAVNNPSSVDLNLSHCASAPNPANGCTLNSPLFLSVDSNGDLLVADHQNDRVLLYPASTLSPSNPGSFNCASGCVIQATMVWGQYGSFYTAGHNQAYQNQGATDPCPNESGGYTVPTQCTLDQPYQAIADAQGNLFISDTNNSRVLEYDGALNTGPVSYQQAATMVYGQGGSFTTADKNHGGLSAASLAYPTGLALDPAGNLWVAEPQNNRVLEFPPAVTANRTAATTAIQALGARGSFTSGTANYFGVNAGSLYGPLGLAFDGSGNAYVTDYGNGRVLEYLQPYPISARIGLAAGWNLLALPSTTSLPYSAASVVNQVNQEGGNVSEVAVYANGSYRVYVPGYANDFAITPKQGFWVLATRASTWAIT